MRGATIACGSAVAFSSASDARAVSPVRESQLLPQSFIQEGILAPAGGETGIPSAIRVEEDPGSLLVRLSGVFITDDSSKLRPKGLPLPEEADNRVTVDLSLGFADTEKTNIAPPNIRAQKVKEAILNSGVIGKRMDTRALNVISRVITDVAGGMVVFPDQDSTTGVVQALVIGTEAVSAAPIIGAITVTDTGEGSRVVAEPLQGIFLAAKDEAARSELSPGVQQSAETSLPADALEPLQRYIGQTATLATLRKISREIISIYRKNDMPVVDVAIPDQEIKDNIVTFVAIEARVGNVEKKGGNWISEKQLAHTFANHGVKKGALLKQRNISAAMNQMNATGFRHVDVILRQGEKYGESDVIASVKDRFPVRFYWGWDNTGNESTDTERWFTGFNWAEPLGLPHVLSYQFRGAPDTDRYSAHSASYQMWLPWWDHRFLVYGTYSENIPTTALAGLNSEGQATLVGCTYTIPFADISDPNSGWSFEHSAYGGFDYKDSNSDLTFTGINVFNQAIEVGQFTVGYSGKLNDALGYTSIRPSLIFSPGDMFANNDREAFQSQRPGAEPTYQIFSLDWERSFKLPANFEFNTSGHYQFATENLVATEQFGLGGVSSIRGFPERLVAGDEGYYTQTELRTPPISIAKLAGFTSTEQDKLVFFGFFDYGEVGPQAFNPASTIDNDVLGSAGLGFRYNLSSYLSMELSYGFRLMTPDAVDADGSELKYSFTLAY